MPIMTISKWLKYYEINVCELMNNKVWYVINLLSCVQYTVVWIFFSFLEIKLIKKGEMCFILNV